MKKETSYGRKNYHRRFSYVQRILTYKTIRKRNTATKKEGLTHRETGKKLGFEKDKIKKFIERYNAKAKKLSAGIEIKPKGRPRKVSIQ